MTLSYAFVACYLRLGLLPALLLDDFVAVDLADEPFVVGGGVLSPAPTATVAGVVVGVSPDRLNAHCCNICSRLLVTQ